MMTSTRRVALKKHVVAIIYDSITNSVFESQVLAPLVKMLASDVNLCVTLVSFERGDRFQKYIGQYGLIHGNLNIVILSKISISGMCLSFDVKKIIRFLEKNPCQRVIARGPLAGLIVLRALVRMLKRGVRDHKSIPMITIQARGLCAEEYRYVNFNQKYFFFKKIFHGVRYKILYDIEKMVYGGVSKQLIDSVQMAQRSCYKPKRSVVVFEAVSPAMKEYLVSTFKTNRQNIVIARRDIPESVDRNFVKKWRDCFRKKLNIPDDAYVYCYSGSYRSWQCVKETIEFFEEQCYKNKKSFLFVLSKDKDHFVQEIQRCGIPEDRYCVISVQPDQLVCYLAVADVGLLFRKPDIINWVSRPTKMLEYRAVGLKIIHNNTIAWLAEEGKGLLDSDVQHPPQF